MISLCCNKLVQITTDVTLFSWPYGYVGQRVLQSNRNEGIHPMEHPGVPFFWMEELQNLEAYSVCLSSWEPLSLPNCQIVLLAAANTVPLLWRWISVCSVLPFLSISLDSLMFIMLLHFLSGLPI